MVNPFSAMFDPMYKAAVAVDKVERLVKILEKDGIDLEHVATSSPGSLERLTKFVNDAVKKINAIHKKQLKPHQEEKLVEFIMTIGRVISRSKIPVKLPA